MSVTQRTERAQAAHTPGPWRTGEGSRWGSRCAVYVGHEPEFVAGQRVALCYRMRTGPGSDTFDAEDAANARLIAAAPELLALAERAYVMLEGMFGELPAHYPERQFVEDLREMVARARGEEAPR